MNEGWIHNNWSDDNVKLSNGELTLELNTDDSRGKSFTGGEVQTNDRFGYGTYSVTMKASGEAGVNSSFFTYTGPYFGHTWNEIDFEFLGKDPTKVSIAYHNGDVHWSKWVDLGFDASKGYHTYSFDWQDNKITWYADGKALYTATGDGIPDTPGKMYMNIWTGMNDWLGKPTFDGSTTAHYKDVSFTPASGQPSTPPGGNPSPTPTGTLSLYLVDADTDKDIQKITDGATIRLGADVLDDITVVARVTGANGEVQSIKLELDGAIDRTTVENTPPYALFGDNHGNLHGGLTTGSYSLKADAWSQDHAKGTLRATTDIDFTIASNATPEANVVVKVLNAATGRVLTTLTDGATLDTKALKTSNLAFVATATGDKSIVDDIESFVFDLDGTREHWQVENISPYALFGDNGSSPYGRSFAKGSYELEIEAYDHDHAGGPVLASQDFDFLIV